MAIEQARRATEAATKEPATSSPPERQHAGASHSRAAGDLRPTRIVALQRAAGNGAVVSLLDKQPVVARQRRPAPHQNPLEPRVNELERRQRILERRQAAADVDTRWRPRFGELFSTRRQAILRISGAMDAAAGGFQAAQVAQAQTDAMQTALIAGAATVLFAGGFEWAFAQSLGALGVGAQRIQRVVELIENPANAAASSAGGVAGLRTSAASAQAGQVPATAPEGGAPSGSAMAFLTSQMEALEQRLQGVEHAFTDRQAGLQQLTDAQWEAYDAEAQNARYQQLLSDIERTTKGAERLKPATALARVLERRMWAQYIAGLADASIESQRAADEAAMASGSGSLNIMGRPLEADISIGTDIEVRLNEVDVSSGAGVTLSGHVYSRNSPSDWKQRLISWSRGPGRSETIRA